MAKRKRQEPKTESSSIPEDEQWRLIQDSGILQDYDGPNARVLHRDMDRSSAVDEPPSGDLADRIFDAVLLIIPLSFFYLLMDILVQQQYGQHPTVSGELKHLASAIPAISFFVFFSHNIKSERRTQFIMFWVSIASGLRLIYVVNHGAMLQVTRQGPPLATIWVYVVVQLTLGPAVLSLAAVAAGVQYLDLKIVFVNLSHAN
ncbi:hypothetical protein BS47DRAFT_1384056 [Hydnum rufescens UP504]|uniref:DUF7719 domain-containing protein n=1 Tax=Hydnum rufescens UP504 TaxID=1448309 RepID=A0A9P6AR93_9AGAM|nr:hypothetical protein BS47DRAFT_1384056 [Hydnum rufescens UP504]